MKIYTRGGDRGETSLLGGDRVSKSSPRIEAYGTVDELNAFVGLARASWPQSPIDGELLAIQADLFDVGAHLAAPGEPERFPGPAASRIEALELGIDRMEERLQPLRQFILPSGSLPASALHIARTVCRRAERLVVFLGDDSRSPAVVIYLNRLSDYLFVAARFANHSLSVDDVPWQGR